MSYKNINFFFTFLSIDLQPSIKVTDIPPLILNSYDLAARGSIYAKCWGAGSNTMERGLIFTGGQGGLKIVKPYQRVLLSYFTQQYRFTS